MIISTFFDCILSAATQSGLSLSDTAERCLSFGVTGVDVEDCQVSDPRLKTLLDAGMQITSMPTRRDFLHAPTRETVEEIIRLALRYKVPRILIIPGYFQPDDDENTVRNAIEPLSYLCTLAEKEKITVGVEDYDHEDAPTHTINGLNFFLREVPKLSCIFDTGNFLFGGEDVMEAYRLMKHRITSQIHCKDRALVGRAGETPMRSLTGDKLYSCAVGRGILPIRDIVKDLLESGFDGVFTAELFGSPDMLADLEASAEFLKKLCAHALKNG